MLLDPILYANRPFFILSSSICLFVSLLCTRGSVQRINVNNDNKVRSNVYLQNVSYSSASVALYYIATRVTYDYHGVSSVLHCLYIKEKQVLYVDTIQEKMIVFILTINCCFIHLTIHRIR